MMNWSSSCFLIVSSVINKLESNRNCHHKLYNWISKAYWSSLYLYWSNANSWSSVISKVRDLTRATNPRKLPLYYCTAFISEPRNKTSLLEDVEISFLKFSYPLFNLLWLTAIQSAINPMIFMNQTQYHYDRSPAPHLSFNSARYPLFV